MYTTHTTRCIILGSKPRSDSDKIFWCFTEDFGLIVARAKSIRRENSRLRYSLQDHSLTKISFVRGKNGIRLTGAFHTKVLNNSKALGVFARVSTLIKKMVHGELENKELFEVLSSAHDEFSNANLCKDAEIILVLKTLFILGYVSEFKESGGVLMENKINIFLEEDQRKIILQHINQALMASHLV